MPEPGTMSGYRFERKFFIKELSKEEVESIVHLHPALFSEIFTGRHVNNIYFDSTRMRHYGDNVDGSRDRKKYRIRWYGGLVGHVGTPTLEIKIKTGHLGRKASFPLVAMELGERLDESALCGVLARSSLPDGVRAEIMELGPVLVNRYRRQYFRSADDKFRITIDTNFSFYRIATPCSPWIAPFNDDTSVILELKYEPEDDESVRNITSAFPFRMSKSSKYADGIARLYSW